MLYKKLIRPVLFSFDPEKVHNFTIQTLKFIFKLPFANKIVERIFFSYKNKISFCGLNFDSRVGIAAGFDKNAEIFDQMYNFGFGFVEIGTITPKPQKGNPKPRLFRLKKDNAIINRMGFNNHGVDVIKKRLQNRNSNVIIGGNIGKNKNTPNDKAFQDYLISFEKLFPVVDYFAVNISSPNTPDLRLLQQKNEIFKILNILQKANMDKEKQKPIFVKIAPDLNFQQIDDIIEAVIETKISGIIATNTTIAREQGLIESKDNIDKIGQGGLSGKPLKNTSNEIIKYIYKKSQGKIKIIASGGILSPEDAVEKIKAGASMLQIYTGFIFEGPSLVKKINEKIAHLQI